MRLRAAIALAGVSFFASLCTCVASAAPVTMSFWGFGYGTLLYAPAGVVQVEVTAVGGAGGSACALGGRGALVHTIVRVTPGQQLRGEVGGVGESSEAVRGAPPCPGGTGHGWYPSGWGGMGGGGFGGGGSSGGGASWVAALPESSECCLQQWGHGELLVVAGGGGGGGYGSGATGGDAGAVGEPGVAAGFGGHGGGGGTTVGGSGGAGGAGAECEGVGGAGWSGSSGRGGAGGSGGSIGESKGIEPAGGGGGGGGYFGGGGGGGGVFPSSYQPSGATCVDAGGGGGGSSFVAYGPLSAETTNEPPHISVTYSPLSPPTASISTPGNGAVYEEGQVVRTLFSCSDAAGAPGIRTCEGTRLNDFGTVPSFASTPLADGDTLYTGQVGSFSIKVFALSKDALTATAYANYTVVPKRTLPSAPTAAPTPPLLSDVSQAHTRWREGSRLVLVSRRSHLPVGTTFAFSLNMSATVWLAFARQGSHHREVNVMTIAGKPGMNRVAFDGRVSRLTRLKAGSYSLTLRAVNNAGQSAPGRLRFAIVR